MFILVRVFCLRFCLSHQEIYSFVISKPQLRLERFPSKEHNEQLKMLSFGASAEILLLSHKTSSAGRDAWLTELQAHLCRSVVFLPNHFFAISGKQLIRCMAKGKTGWSRSEHLRKSPWRIVGYTTRSFSRIDSYTALCSRWTLTASDVGKAPKPRKSINTPRGCARAFSSRDDGKAAKFPLKINSVLADVKLNLWLQFCMISFRR